MEQIHNYFGVGQIYKQGYNAVLVYKVQSVKDLALVIKHFDKYSLITQKRADYELWKRVVEIIQSKEHLTLEGLQKIVAIKATLNRGLSEELKLAFPLIILFPRPLINVVNQEIPDPQWVAGFTSGEGCFQISLSSSANSKLKMRVQLEFSVIQHVRDEQLISKLIKYFDCGNVYLKKQGQAVEYRVFKFSNLENKILPFLLNIQLLVKNLKILKIDVCEAGSWINQRKETSNSGRLRPNTSNKIWNK